MGAARRDGEHRGIAAVVGVVVQRNLGEDFRRSRPAVMARLRAQLLVNDSGSYSYFVASRFKLTG